MNSNQIAYLPVSTYPEAPSDDAIRATVEFVAMLGCALHVTTFAVDIPQMNSPLGGVFLDVPRMVHAAEEKSKAECVRVQGVVRQTFGTGAELDVVTRVAVLGSALDAAATEARYHDVAVLPWGGASLGAQDMAQAVLFGSGRPTLIVPETAPAAPLEHIAIAWDGSRVAARAMWDALALLPQAGRITILTVRDEKVLSGPDLALSLATALQKRGYEATAVDITLEGQTIAGALQAAALGAGAQLLAMGGFGHSRLRDFILGGATKGVLHDLRLPMLLAH